MSFTVGFDLGVQFAQSTPIKRLTQEMPEAASVLRPEHYFDALQRITDNDDQRIMHRWKDAPVEVGIALALLRRRLDDIEAPSMSAGDRMGIYRKGDPATVYTCDPNGWSLRVPADRV